MTLKEHCIENKLLALLYEWSEKNGDLQPSNILTTSNAKVWWSCSCGNEWRATIQNRINGQGCPLCQPKDAILPSKKPPRKDLTGKRFGRLVVLEHAGIKRESIWKCRCDCGNEVLVRNTNLVNKKTTSCGCKRTEVRRQNFRENIHFVDGTCIEKIVAKNTNKNNTSGFRGVSKRENGNFRVSITFKGKRYNLGSYATIQEAVYARLAGEVMVDEFVENFKKANCNSI
ncbi:MAG: zinc-ribbon domain-containing protein [Clostridia bacterium]